MARIYEVVREFSDTELVDDLSIVNHWIIAVVRLGKPLSYSRKDKKSITDSLNQGALAHGKTLIITDDCQSLTIGGSKESHIKQLIAQLHQSEINYLKEILPGDWVLAWMIHGQEKYFDIIKRIQNGKQCNTIKDGFKFLGRVGSIRKKTSLNPVNGIKISSYSLQAMGFKELDTQIFYDHNLSTNDIESQNIGSWLAKIGLSIQDIFGTISSAGGGAEDNVDKIIPSFMETLLGRGVGSGLNRGDDPQLRAVTGGGSLTIGTVTQDKPNDAPFAYLVPKEVGDLLGKTSRDVSKAGGILAYADILELIHGVQKYEGNSVGDDTGIFIPKISESKGNHHFTGENMMGSFLPIMPSFDNRPLWNVLQQFLNPVINEMYTCLRINQEGDVVPTMVLRQIPFTTSVLANKFNNTTTTESLGSRGFNVPTQAETSLREGAIPNSNIPKFTEFMELPRWRMRGILVQNFDIGRSDVTRINFVHVYGQNSLSASNVSITEQLVQNPPIRDDLDIQRSGLHAFMGTTACREINRVGAVPGMWMEIIADKMIGSQYTLNGTMECYGIEAPICEGDNLEFDGVVYHIESITHTCNVSDVGGIKVWRTNLSLTNGMAIDDNASEPAVDFPKYPGVNVTDNTGYDPGLTSDNDLHLSEADLEEEGPRLSNDDRNNV